MGLSWTFVYAHLLTHNLRARFLLKCSAHGRAYLLHKDAVSPDTACASQTQTSLSDTRPFHALLFL